MHRKVGYHRFAIGAHSLICERTIRDRWTRDRSASTSFEGFAQDMNLDWQICSRARLSRDPRFDGKFFIGVIGSMRLLPFDLSRAHMQKKKTAAIFRARPRQPKPAFALACAAVQKVRPELQHGWERPTRFRELCV